MVVVVVVVAVLVAVVDVDVTVVVVVVLLLLLLSSLVKLVFVLAGSEERCKEEGWWGDRRNYAVKDSRNESGTVQEGMFVHQLVNVCVEEK